MDGGDTLSGAAGWLADWLPGWLAELSVGPTVCILLKQTVVVGVFVTAAQISASQMDYLCHWATISIAISISIGLETNGAARI